MQEHSPFFYDKMQTVTFSLSNLCLNRPLSSLSVKPSELSVTSNQLRFLSSHLKQVPVDQHCCRIVNSWKHFFFPQYNISSMMRSRTENWGFPAAIHPPLPFPFHPTPPHCRDWTTASTGTQNTYPRAWHMSPEKLLKTSEQQKRQTGSQGWFFPSAFWQDALPPASLSATKFATCGISSDFSLTVQKPVAGTSRTFEHAIDLRVERSTQPIGAEVKRLTWKRSNETVDCLIGSVVLDLLCV